MWERISKHEALTTVKLGMGTLSIRVRVMVMRMGGGSAGAGGFNDQVGGVVMMLIRVLKMYCETDNADYDDG